MLFSAELDCNVDKQHREMDKGLLCYLVRGSKRKVTHQYPNSLSMVVLDVPDHVHSDHNIIAVS